MLVTEFGSAITPHNAQIALLDELRSLFELQESIDEFIGSHPVALLHDNMQLLLTEDYLVCEKTDGIRLMLFVFERVVYLYDRKNIFYRTDHVFVGTDPFTFLFDGEMYLEDEKYVFAMFDCLIYDTKVVTECNLNERLGYCFKFARAVAKGAILRKNDSPYKKFQIIGKEMFKSYAFPEILKGIPHLQHENDGLIFTPVHEPYKLNSRSTILKWKPPHLNTVDFVIKRSDDASGIYELRCVVSEDQTQSIEKGQFGVNSVIFDYYFAEDNNDNDIDGKIGEFSYDSNGESIDLTDLNVVNGSWCLHRIRSDKNTPNNIKIVLDVVESLKESVRSEDLCELRDAIRKNYKERESSR